MLTKAQFLEPLTKLRTDRVIVATMGVARPWGRMSSSDLHFASADGELAPVMRSNAEFRMIA